MGSIVGTLAILLLQSAVKVSLTPSPTMVIPIGLILAAVRTRPIKAVSAQFGYKGFLLQG